ncbi:hypothetical protein SS05631_c07090 [Sinorhizobium sp. CCBAU 05631]|nr:hypothetical protein SAMCCGM7_Ch1037 [Sinorhizobium americanum CCGM7]ASY55662.1 hypothetical protein SS05631_c07090 [Sinorhizobium sp. CCBAU 05631]
MFSGRSNPLARLPVEGAGMMASWLFDGSNIFLMCLSFQHNSPRYT